VVWAIAGAGVVDQRLEALTADADTSTDPLRRKRSLVDPLSGLLGYADQGREWSLA